MRQALEPSKDLRGNQRFRVSLPIFLGNGEQPLAGFTRDISSRGVYFYVSAPDILHDQEEFDFIVELPPEVTLSSRCKIRCVGRALRLENRVPELTGIAAEILDYSISKQDSVSS